MVGTKEISFDFGRSRSLENAFQNMWFASIHQWKCLVLGHYLKFERTYLVLRFDRIK